MTTIHIMRFDLSTFCGVVWNDRPQEWHDRGDKWINAHQAEGELKLIEGWSGDKACKKCLEKYKARLP